MKVLTDSSAVPALSGVVLEEMSEHLGLGEVVDGDDFVSGGVEHLSECETSDSAESIDCNFY